MTTGLGMDRTGILAPQGAEGLAYPKINRIVGGMPTLVSHGESATAKTLFRSELIPTDKFTLGFQYLFTVMGLLGSDSEDIVLDIDLVEPDDTRHTVVACTTVSLANEDDDVFEFKSQGIVVLEQSGVTSGQVAAVSKIRVEQGTPMIFVGQTAITGAAVDFRGLTLKPDGTTYQNNGLYFELYADWDASHAKAVIEVFGAMLQLSNIHGGAGFVA